MVSTLDQKVSISFPVLTESGSLFSSKGDHNPAFEGKSVIWITYEFMLLNCGVREDS